MLQKVAMMMAEAGNEVTETVTEPGFFDQLKDLFDGNGWAIALGCAAVLGLVVAGVWVYRKFIKDGRH